MRIPIIRIMTVSGLYWAPALCKTITLGFVVQALGICKVAAEGDKIGHCLPVFCFSRGHSKTHGKSHLRMTQCVTTSLPTT